MIISYMLHKVFEIYKKAMEERKLKLSTIGKHQLSQNTFTYKGYNIITPKELYEKIVFPFIGKTEGDYITNICLEYMRVSLEYKIVLEEKVTL